MPNTVAHTVPETVAPNTEQCELQVRRILQSTTFRNATTLQQLLQFLAAKSATGSNDALKEYTIGVEALGRKQDFDPKIDPIVRVQSHRLRLKLKEYYDAEGRHDPVLIQIPKGHYLPTFETLAAPMSHLDRRSTYEPEPAISVTSLPGDLKVESALPETVIDRWRLHWPDPAWIGMALAAIAIFAFGCWLGDKHAKSLSGPVTEFSSADSDSAKTPDPVRDFWAGFLGNDSAPVIAYPDAVFLLDDSNDLFRFRQGASDSRGVLVDPHLARQFASNPSLVAQAGQLYYENGYTGTGELESIAMLAGLLGRMGIKPIIKSSRDITPDDLKQHNVILLGSPFQNIAVAQLLTTGDFTFKNPDSRHEQWRAQIVNAHPRSNEQPAYGTERDRSTQALKADYSLITIAPGVVPGRYIAILGGLDTTGTEGATVFATSRPGIEELTKALGSIGEKGTRTEPPLFQALVRVQLAKGYQVLSADLMAVHQLHSADTKRAGNTITAVSAP
ncbi:hypothetical protein [Acidicapsa acidisoli]|uniref:hypothetical protein n=1 Tax=Acidicapsa acidisoli TaxID=1615681 RepID=UPI0021E0DD0A|nr:hypothetical protein [Acidicapsa acidisoli]